MQRTSSGSGLYKEYLRRWAGSPSGVVHRRALGRYAAPVVTWVKEHARWMVLAVLILINLVLVALLLVRQASYSAVPASTPTWTPTVQQPSPVPSASPSPTASPGRPTPTTAPGTPTSDQEDSGPRRLMAANSGTIAWRAEEGSCSKRATVEVTTDGGRTWRETNPGIRGIVRLRAYGDDSVFAVGADKDCKPTYAWTTSPSGDWKRNPSIMFDVWFRYPSDKSRVHAPGGREFQPCGGASVVSFAGIGTSRAAALCPDGRIRTIAGGRDWRTVQTKSEAAAINADDSTFVAARMMKGCDGVVVQTFTASGKGLENDGRPCRRVSVGESDPVGVAVDGSAEWLWVGPELLN